MAAGVVVVGGGLAIGLTPGPTGGQPHDEPGTTHGEGGETHDSPTSVEPQDVHEAETLVSEMDAAISRFSDVTIAEEAGYHWIGDEFDGYRHYIQPLYMVDSVELDQTKVESLVYQTEPDGSLTLVSGMFILSPGETMADVPEVAGGLAVWHEHTNLCFAGDRLTTTTEAGTCPSGRAPIETPPMLHVWIVDHPDGPFAAIEGHG
jgi:hypothetical protein